MPTGLGPVMPDYGSGSVQLQNTGRIHPNMYNQTQQTYHPQVITPSVPTVRRNTDDVMRLIERYKILWQGLLCLKNDAATVQLHYIFGSSQMADRSLPKEQMMSTAGVSLPQLRIVQRMRLEPPQVETVQSKMFDSQQSCTMIALPCGRDEGDVHNQTASLRQRFIDYLASKQAAGIVNIPKRYVIIYLVYVSTCNTRCS